MCSANEWQLVIWRTNVLFIGSYFRIIGTLVLVYTSNIRSLSLTCLRGLEVAELKERLLWEDNAIAKNGKFKLYPTDNMFNFIMVDVINGRTWQVQWNIDENKRLVYKFY